MTSSISNREAAALPTIGKNHARRYVLGFGVKYDFEPPQKRCVMLVNRRFLTTRNTAISTNTLRGFHLCEGCATSRDNLAIVSPSYSLILT